MENRLVQTTTSDKLYLHGYYSPSQDRKTCVLHIHGFEGNFYENNFVYVLEKTLRENNIGFIAVNTRGNGKDTDFNTTEGTYKRIGAWYEILEEAHLDITAWVKFLLADGVENIVLMGHSLGTMKVVRYLFEGEFKDKIAKLILLAPFDKKGMFLSMMKKDVSDLLDISQKMVDTGKGSEIRSRDLGGNSVSYRTLLSWAKQDELGRMFEFCSKDYDFPILKGIKVPTLIVVGTKDQHFHQSNPEHPEEAVNILLKNIPDSKGKLIDNAGHSFRGYEEVMAKEVASFVL